MYFFVQSGVLLKFPKVFKGIPLPSAFCEKLQLRRGRYIVAHSLGQRVMYQLVLHVVDLMLPPKFVCWLYTSEVHEIRYLLYLS